MNFAKNTEQIVQHRKIQGDIKGHEMFQQPQVFWKLSRGIQGPEQRP